MGYDANNDTYATSCDEFSDSESELSSVEMLFKGYEPSLVVLDGSDHALFAQIEQLIDCIRAAKLIQQIRVSTAFLQGLDVMDSSEAEVAAVATNGGKDKHNDVDDKDKACPESDALFAAIAGLAPICETFVCHLHRHLPRAALEKSGSGLLKCVQSISHLTLNNFLLTDELIAALGANQELTELRAYVDSKEEEDGLDSLFRALSKSPRLQQLDVYAKEDERPEKPRRLTAVALTELVHNPALKEAKLWHLDTLLTEALGMALETTESKLECLSLNQCFIKNQGYFALANMLKKNKTLLKIQISDIVSADACIEFANGLAENNTLEHLELTYESDSDKVGHAMVKMLEVNKTIKYLKLYMSYSFENDMSFSAVKGTEYEEAQAADDWETKMEDLLEMNRSGSR